MASAYQEKIDIGRVLERGFGVIGRNAGPFLILALLFSGIPTYLQQSVILGQFGGSQIGGWSGFPIAFLGLYFLTFFGASLLQAAVVRTVVMDLNGRRADLGASLQTAFVLLLPMLGLTIVSSLGIGLAFLLLIVPGIIVYVMWSVAVPVLVEEKAGIIGSLSRSADLTSGSRWRIFGIFVILFIISTMLGWVVGLLGMSLIRSAPWVVAAMSAVSAMFSSLLSASMVAAIYVELRNVKEGGSAESLVAIFD